MRGVETLGIIANDARIGQRGHQPGREKAVLRRGVTVIRFIQGDAGGPN